MTPAIETAAMAVACEEGCACGDDPCDKCLLTATAAIEAWVDGLTDDDIVDISHDIGWGIATSCLKSDSRDFRQALKATLKGGDDE